MCGDIYKTRFDKAYAPVMAAAFVLDPCNLIKDEDTDRFVPQWDTLSLSQKGHVRQVLKQFVPDNRYVKLVEELTTFCSDGVPSDVADIVKSKNVMSIRVRMYLWQHDLKDVYPLIAKSAPRIISLQSTSCAPERNWSLWTKVYNPQRSRLHAERAAKMIYIAQSNRITRNEFKSEEVEDEFDIIYEDEDKDVEAPSSNAAEVVIQEGVGVGDGNEEMNEDMHDTFGLEL